MISVDKLTFNKEEDSIRNKIISLKAEAGSHSPSIHTLTELIPGLSIKVDACFLSNPYATELYMDYFEKEILEKGKLRDLLEFYPSQNDVIAYLLSKSIGIDHKKIFIGNGAIEIIQAIIHRFAKQKMVVNIPTFSSYYEFAKDDLKIDFFLLKKEDNFNLNVDDYISFIKQVKPDTIVLINPNNPTGNYIIKSELVRVLEELSFVDNIIIDESFIHFAFEDEFYSEVTLSRLVNEHKNMYIVKSMSKDFGIAGVRAGYAIMDENKIEELLKNGYLWNSNGLAEHFFRLYGKKDFIKKYQVVRKRYIEETQQFIIDIARVPNIKVYPSSANFVLIELPDGVSAELITSILLIRYGIYVRNCDDKIGLKGSYLRIASRGKADNEKIIEALVDLFS
jgi:histidinol-phosphate/aromatic aminotransferase/cobyric acid decarboxylase-like protein